MEVAREIIAGGARILQLRDKITVKKDLLPVARKLKTLCAESGVLFIVNDALDIALAVEAGGLHIGQEDMPVRVARKLMPIDMLIGCSVLMRWRHSRLSPTVLIMSASAQFSRLPPKRQLLWVWKDYG
jgi:thiamine-phosphate diphosphorylase